MQENFNFNPLCVLSGSQHRQLKICYALGRIIVFLILPPTRKKVGLLLENL